MFVPLMLVSSTFAFSSWPPPGGEGPCSVTKEADVPARMRDGVVLKADVYCPATKELIPAS